MVTSDGGQSDAAQAGHASPTDIESEQAAQRTLVHGLMHMLASDDDETSLIETHISYVLLTRQYAYKIKKAVRFPFLDYGTLHLRHEACKKELALNRRLAPDLYLDVVAIHGTPERPALASAGTVIEYAVKMRAFGQQALADGMLERGELLPEYIDRIAERLVLFHQQAAIAAVDSPFGEPARIDTWARDNLDEIRALARGRQLEADLADLEVWTQAAYVRLRPLLVERKRGGRVRECHGDLHLGNIAIIDRRPCLFDCIEFNDELRWNDVFSELAFLMMDLQFNERPDLAARLLDAYLQASGDFAGLAVLRYYLVYRALVRAKIALLALPVQTERYARHLALARTHMVTSATPIIVLHGFSGSGKSHLAAQLLERLSAVRVRSDVERKRLAGLDALARTRSVPGSALYSPASTADTYAHLLALARDIVQAGFAVIIDACSLRKSERSQFRSLAAELGQTFCIISVAAEQATMQQRIRERERRASDASEANLEVLNFQQTIAEPIEADEMPYVIHYRSDGPEAGNLPSLCTAIHALIHHSVHAQH